MTVWLSEQITSIISNVCLYNTLYTVTLRSNRNPRLNAPAANACHHIGFRWTAFWGFISNPSCLSRLLWRILFDVIFKVTFLEGIDILIKLIKKIIWQPGSQIKQTEAGWRMKVESSCLRRVNANMILIPQVLHSCCFNAAPTFHHAEVLEAGHHLL